MVTAFDIMASPTSLLSDVAKGIDTVIMVGSSEISPHTCWVVIDYAFCSAQTSILTTASSPCP